MAIDINLIGIVAGPTVGVPEIEIPGLNEFQVLLYQSDLDNVFFNQNDFPTEARYYHSSLDKWEDYFVNFDNPHASFALGDAPDFNTLRPQFMVSEAALAHRILKKDRVKIKGTLYLIDDFISDGVGVTTVFLRIK